MKKWQHFLILFGLLIILNIFADFIRDLTTNGVLNHWSFVGLWLTTLVIMWFGAWAGIKTLKDKKTSDKKKTFIKYFISFVLIGSLSIVYDVAEYFLQNNLLNYYSLVSIEACCIFIGLAGGRLDNLLHKQKKQKAKRC